MTAAEGNTQHSARHSEISEELRLLGLALLDKVEPGMRSVFAGLRVEAAAAAEAAVSESVAAESVVAESVVAESVVAESVVAEPVAAEVAAAKPVAAKTVAAEPVAAATAGAAAGHELPATCQWCPVCAMIAVFRGEAPELGGRLAEQGETLLTVLRAVLEQPAQQPPAPQPPAGGGC